MHISPDPVQVVMWILNWSFKVKFQRRQTITQSSSAGDKTILKIMFILVYFGSLGCGESGLAGLFQVMWLLCFASWLSLPLKNNRYDVMILFLLTDMQVCFKLHLRSYKHITMNNFPFGKNPSWRIYSLGLVYQRDLERPLSCRMFQLYRLHIRLRRHEERSLNTMWWLIWPAERKWNTFLQFSRPHSTSFQPSNIYCQLHQHSQLSTSTMSKGFSLSCHFPVPAGALEEMGQLKT